MPLQKKANTMLSATVALSDLYYDERKLDERAALGNVNVDYGDEAWASFEGKAVAVGTYRSGELHPSRVFNQ